MIEIHRNFSSSDQLSTIDNVLLICTDFTKPKHWKEIVKALSKPTPKDKFMAHVDFLYSKELSGVPSTRLIPKHITNYEHDFVFICDKETMNSKDSEILVLDLNNSNNRSFRAKPSQIQDIENNLSISNMDWEDFSSNLDSTGLFLGWE